MVSRPVTIQQPIEGKMENLSKTIEKEAAFVRLAEARTNRALKAMRLITNLGNRHVYNYSQEQAQSIVAALEKSIADIKAAFNDKTPQQFTLGAVHEQ